MMIARNTAGGRAEARLIGELGQLVQKLATFGPLKEILQTCGVALEGQDAWRLSAIMVEQLCRVLTKLPRPKTTRWTADTDLALEIQMIGLCYEPEGLSERKAINKIAGAWDFPYTPQTGRRSPKSDARTQREEALRKRWKDLKRRNRLLDATLRLDPRGEKESASGHLEFPSFAAHSTGTRRESA